MQLKHFIDVLQKRYADLTKDPEWLEMYGEPEIVIDVFADGESGLQGNVPTFYYAGYTPEIELDSDPGSGYIILRAFKTD